MKCNHYSTQHCLSCDLLAHDYLSSVAIKQQTLAALFPEYLDNIKPPVMVEGGADGQRNKAKLAVAIIGGEIEFGFYNQAFQFKKLEDCPLHAPAINAILGDLKKILSTYKIIPYDLFTKQGELKYVLITYSESSNELLLRFILRSSESLLRLKKLTAELLTLFENIKVVTANIQPIHQAILEGDKEEVLTERDYITHCFGEYTLLQGPRSFFQTNSQMALALYSQFQYQLSSLFVNHFLDLYCGVGAFSFFAARHCNKVVGIEISDAAIHFANTARLINKIDNVSFHALDVEKYLSSKLDIKVDAVMVNPPRRGLNENIIDQLIALDPKYIFYSSCNAHTLQRDVVKLKEKYQVVSLQLFDMFPFVSHFETLALLTRFND
jgi:23S rRNA (uracil747-C5)-methyltransferase